MDATILLAMIQKISNRYKLDYEELKDFCGLTLPLPTPLSKKVKLEHITIDEVELLYNSVDNAVYRQRKQGTVKYIGKLCLETYKVILST